MTLLEETATDGGSEEGFIDNLLNTNKHFGSNLTGLMILCIVLTAIAVVFFGCYLMMKFMHRALSGDDTKDEPGPLSPYGNVVMHTKRVYEIQAEEGCFSLSSDESEDQNNSPTPTTTVVEVKQEDEEAQKRVALKKPETGDIRAMRNPERLEDDPKQFLRKKEKKVHKDSVCAFLFKPQQPEPKLV